MASTPQPASPALSALSSAREEADGLAARVAELEQKQAARKAAKAQLEEQATRAKAAAAAAGLVTTATAVVPTADVPASSPRAAHPHSKKLAPLPSIAIPTTTLPSNLPLASPHSRAAKLAAGATRPTTAPKQPTSAPHAGGSPSLVASSVPTTPTAPHSPLVSSFAQTRTSSPAMKPTPPPPHSPMPARSPRAPLAVPPRSLSTTSPKTVPMPFALAAPSSSPAQVSSLGLLLGLQAPPSMPVPPPMPLFTLLPPPPAALAFPSLPALFTSRRSDGRRQGIIVGGGGGLNMRASLAAFRAQLGKGGEGADSGSDDDDDSNDESDDERKPKKAAPKAKPPKSAAAQVTLANGQHFPPDCTNKESRPSSGCARPSIFHCQECKQNYCMDCDDLVHLRPAKKNHQRVRVTRENMDPHAAAPATKTVKVVMKAAKALPATSLAGLKEQQAEEKQNHATTAAAAPARGRGGIGRIGAAGPNPMGVIESSTSSIPLNLPRTANLLQFISNECLRNLPGTIALQIFDHYAANVPAGEAKDKLRKEDLLKLSGDILERVRRHLGEELKKQGIGPNQIPSGIERELESTLKGKNDEERKGNLLLLLCSKTGSHKASIPKSAFLQQFGSICAELFTVRSDGALGCVIC